MAGNAREGTCARALPGGSASASSPCASGALRRTASQRSASTNAGRAQGALVVKIPPVLRRAGETARGAAAENHKRSIRYISLETRLWWWSGLCACSRFAGLLAALKTAMALWTSISSSSTRCSVCLGEGGSKP